MNLLLTFRYLLLFGIVLFLAGILPAQRAPDKILVVNGKIVGAPVVQINGRSYVDVDTLAQVTNGVLSVMADRGVLTIRAATPPSPQATPPQGLSKEFARDAIGVLAELREWRGAIGTVRSYNVPFSGTILCEIMDSPE